MLFTTDWCHLREKVCNLVVTLVPRKELPHNSSYRYNCQSRNMVMLFIPEIVAILRVPNSQPPTRNLCQRVEPCQEAKMTDIQFGGRRASPPPQPQQPTFNEAGTGKLPCEQPGFSEHGYGHGQQEKNFRMLLITRCWER
ncbi:hypothetical protein VTP01DRAFT_2385 [Rhizomucor pusillus]|uniref:uncharacterized protein n=1 Tax=Rhizomucor pusillus TaxID=4840 RepID=UPI003743F511